MTIVFDLGNVLIPFDHGRWVSNLNSINQGLGDRMLNRFNENHDLQMQYEGGKLSDNEFINICLNWLDNEITSDQFCEIFSDIFSFNYNVIELLPELKRRYRLVLLSNTSNIHKSYAWGKYSFIENFDKLILSHEVGAVKPEEKIYRAVENFTNEPPNSHIFIDDVLDYVNAAKNLGWDGIHFIGYENLVDEFKLRGILNNQ
ncbi:MAG: HAD-IA family hydrolase [Melioribacteraceae bacterium]|nr:HAD-IA family hydrolase [Melioribacteraceae bacterium]